MNTNDGPHVLYIAENSDAIDVYSYSKRDGLERILTDFNLPASATAVIGDSENDLAFLSHPGVGLRGAPANAQPCVQAFVGAQHVSGAAGLDGFIAFYETCKRRGIQLVVSDRDGVIKWKDQTSLPAFVDIWKSMGEQGPMIVVLTGSSVEQNLRFIDDYLLDEGRVNPAVQKHPHLIYAENGAVRIDILRRTATSVDGSHASLASLKAAALTQLADTVLPAWELTLTDDPGDQTWKCYVPAKTTMFTVNLPRLDRRGEFFRDTEDAEKLRSEIGQAVRRAAAHIGITLRSEKDHLACLA